MAKNFSIVGYGRMGKIVEQVLKERGKTINSIIDPPQDMKWTKDSLKGTDVALCFVDPEAGYEATKRILEEGVNAIVGTTKFYQNKDGSLNTEMLEGLGKLAEENGVRFLYAPNFSVGVNLFVRGLRDTLPGYARLGYNRPIIIELHHELKIKDVSGTGINLVGPPVLAAYSDRDGLFYDIESAIWPGKNGETYTMDLLRAPFDERVIGKSADQIREFVRRAEAQNKIPLVSIRDDDYPGTHAVLAIGKTDSKMEYHEVTDRKIFAIDAVDKVIPAVMERKPGLYAITDIL